MRFGKSAAEAAAEPSRGGGGDFIKYPKDGDNVIRILQEPLEWLYYWEHFSPQGFSFPCPRDVDDPIDMCPGCSSDNERMKKPSRKIAFNVLTSYNGNEYVNAYKVGPMVEEKLNNRYKRARTITDRDYIITRYKTAADRYDFDVEGGTPTPVDLRKEEWKDIEAMLKQSWDDAWGDGAKPQREAAPAPKRPTIAAAPKPVVEEEPPWAAQKKEEPKEEETVLQEADLRRMEFVELQALIETQLDVSPPASLTTVNAVVDWLMDLSS